MYERRIENSLQKTLRQLNEQKLIKSLTESQEDDANVIARKPAGLTWQSHTQRPPTPHSQETSETKPSPTPIPLKTHAIRNTQHAIRNTTSQIPHTTSDLKKQTQSKKPKPRLTVTLKRTYNHPPPKPTNKNKPNQSQIAGKPSGEDRSNPKRHTTSHIRDTRL